MTAEDYLDALNRAACEGVDLPIEDTAPPPTPWDPDLEHVFSSRRLVVHEERLIADLLQPPTAS